MDSLNPTLRLLLILKLALERGESMRTGLQLYLSGEKDEMVQLVSCWLILRDQGSETFKLINSIKSNYRRVLLDVIERGLKGESILPTLNILETEISQACNEELEKRAALMPIKSLIPLLFLQFPALAILFMAPLFLELMKAM